MPVPERRGTFRSANAVVVAIIVTAGCASRSTVVPRSDPADVAVRFATDLYSADPNRARSLVAATARGEFQVIVNASAGRRLSSTGLQAGEVAKIGNSAIVTVLGTICGMSAEATRSSGTAANSTCVSNSDRGSTDPRFRVSLMKASTGGWVVYFPAPPSNSQEPASVAPPPPTG